MRPYCYVPQGGALIETCIRTVQGRLLLRPDAEANEIMLGVLGRALDSYHVDLFGFSFQGNHVHCLFGAESALQMARFQGYFNGNLAKKLGKHRGWRDKFWARRYRPMVIDDEAEAQRMRLKYLLANGVKEGLVASPLDWPGPNMARAILYEEPLVGVWFNQTKEWAARRRGERFGKYDYATRYEIEVQPLPAFRDLSSDAYRDLVANLVSEIEDEAAAERVGRRVLGVERILEVNPHEAPRKVKKSPAPMLFFARSKEILEAMRSEYADFAKKYREAAERLVAVQRIGERSDPRTDFPLGSFPPALQFVGEALRPPPPRPPSRRLEYDATGRRIVRRGAIPKITVPRQPFSTSDQVPRQGGGCHGPPPASATMV